MGSVLQTPAPSLSALQELQKSYALATLSGGIWVVDLQDVAAVQAGSAREIHFFRLGEGDVLLARHLEALPISSDAKVTIKQFRISPNTKMFNSLAFSPLPTPPTTLNLWVGTTVQPHPGDWTVLKEFMLGTICSGIQADYDYLISFMGHMLLKPEQKPGVMIVLLGGQGTGKGTFCRVVSKLWPRTTLQVSNVDHVVGGFNGALERNYAIIMDEALFSGDRKAADRLKSLITEGEITVEQKHQPRRSMQSFHRFFATSNHAHFAAVDPDDRRFMFLRVSDRHKGDFEYWDRVNAALDDPQVISAMAHDLMGLNLSTYNPRDRPKTPEHMRQKLKSLVGFERYWLEVLQGGDFCPGDGFSPLEPWEAEQFVSTEKLSIGLKTYNTSVRQYAPLQQREIHDALRKVCPSAQSERRKVNGCQQRGYGLPSLSVARVEFEGFMGGAIDWNN